MKCSICGKEWYAFPKICGECVRESMRIRKIMFYDVFKMLCEKKGVSCNRAAMDIGISNSTPTKWKKTGANPDSTTLSKISSYFGVTPDYLLGFTKDSGIDITRYKISDWISVKERLPETDGIYIVCDRRLNGNPWIHTVGFRKASSSWCELHGVYYDDGYGRYREQDKFTHWMPLPEPPEDAQ